MTLKELQDNVAFAVERAVENGEKPEDIIVSLQIDSDPDNPMVPECGSVWSSDEVTLNYDANGIASGCVILAWKDY